MSCFSNISIVTKHIWRATWYSFPNHHTLENTTRSHRARRKGDNNSKVPGHRIRIHRRVIHVGTFDVFVLAHVVSHYSSQMIRVFDIFQTFKMIRSHFFSQNILEFIRVLPSCNFNGWKQVRNPNHLTGIMADMRKRCTSEWPFCKIIILWPNDDAFITIAASFRLSGATVCYWLILITKKGGSFRPFIDLSRLNKFVKNEHF